MSRIKYLVHSAINVVMDILFCVLVDLLGHRLGGELGSKLPHYEDGWSLWRWARDKDMAHQKSCLQCGCRVSDLDLEVPNGDGYLCQTCVAPYKKYCTSELCICGECGFDMADHGVRTWTVTLRDERSDNYSFAWEVKSSSPIEAVRRARVAIMREYRIPIALLRTVSVRAKEVS